MNRRLFFLSSFMFSLNLWAKKHTKRNETLSQTSSFQNVHKNIWVMHGMTVQTEIISLGLSNNPAFIESNNGVIIIDPGGSYALGRYVLQEIRKITSKPVLALFNTHGHNDHFFANAVFQEAYPNIAIYGHEGLKNAATELYGGKYAILGFTFKKAKKVIFPTHPLKGGEIVTIDAERFKIEHPKNAHTNNDITLTHLNSHSIFMGDLLMSHTLANFGLHSSIQGNIRFLEYLNKQKPYTYYISGHGPSGIYQDVFVPYLQYLSIIEEEVIKAYTESPIIIPLHEIKEKILMRLSWKENVTFPYAFIERYIYHIYNEIETDKVF